MQLPKIFNNYNNKTHQFGKHSRFNETSDGSLTQDNVVSWNAETHPNGAGPSNLVSKIAYDNATSKLAVTYKDGFTAVYDNIPRSDAAQFMSSDSKGRWAHRNLWSKPYVAG